MKSYNLSLTLLICFLVNLSLPKAVVAQGTQLNILRGGLDPLTVQQITDGWKSKGWSSKFAAPTVSINLGTGDITPRIIEITAVFRSTDGIVESYTITQTLAAGTTSGAPSWSGKRKWKLRSSLYSGSRIQETEGVGDWSLTEDGDKGWLLRMGNGVGGVFGDIPFRLQGVYNADSAAGPPPGGGETPGGVAADSPFAFLFPIEIHAVSGEAWIYRRGQQIRMTKGVRIEKDDLLETGLTGRMLVIFGDDAARITMSPDTKINIEASLRSTLMAREEAKGFSLFSVFKGVLTFIGELLGNEITFSTKLGGQSGIRGTDFVVSSDPEIGRDDLYVIDGVVDWSTPHGNRSVKANHHLTWTKDGRLGVQTFNPGVLLATGLIWEPPAEVMATLPSMKIGKVWVVHDTHRTVPAWWEKGTAWEGQPAMTIYTQLFTKNLQDKKVHVQITYENADGSLVRWQQGAPPHCAGNDGVLRPWWADEPPTNPFEYQAFRIPVPYAAIDRSSIQASGGMLKVKVKAWRGAAYAIGETTINVLRLLNATQGDRPVGLP